MNPTSQAEPSKDTWFETPLPEDAPTRRASATTILDIPAPDVTFITTRPPLLPENMRAKGGKDTLFSASWFGEMGSDEAPWRAHTQVPAASTPKVVKPVEQTAVTLPSAHPTITITPARDTRSRSALWIGLLAFGVVFAGVVAAGCLAAIGAGVALFLLF